MDIVNIASYRFVAIAQPPLWREPIRARCVALGLRGTVLLAPEGINMFLAGSAEGIDGLLAYLADEPLFEGSFVELEVKRSLSAAQPFRRMLVRLKKEIITMRHPTIRPLKARADAVTPLTLKRWLDSGVDDAGREVILMDTRNAFEIALGTFDGAIDFGIRQFSEFPTAVSGACDDVALNLHDKTVVTFCTGGIRCEKAAIYMHELGLPNVVQLDGGILRYFEDVGDAHWTGECFVFDDRVALDPSLTETGTKQCYACRAVVTPMEQRDVRYVQGESCPHCVDRASRRAA